MPRSYLKGNGVVVPQKMARAASSAMAKWVVCYKLRWGVDMVDRIGRVIFTQLGRQACTQSDVALLQAARTDHGQSWVARSSGRPVALQ
jgi:hypothetical protein